MAKSSATARREDAYDVHPGVAMMVKWVAELKEKTGRTLDEWVRHIRKAGPADEAKARDWLKKEHGLGTNSAWWLAEQAFAAPDALDENTPEGYLKAAAVYVREMYAGPKAELRKIHDELIRRGRSLGRDVKVCPCKTMVPLYREHVFAEIKPSTKPRIDFGLALGELLKAGKTKFPKRLIDTGGFAKKNRITHRIAFRPNRVVAFDGSTPHQALGPSDDKFRMSLIVRGVYECRRSNSGRS